MKKLMMVLVIGMLVLTGCASTANEETTTVCLIPTEDVEKFEVEMTGSKKNLSKIVLRTEFVDNRYSEMSEDEQKAELDELYVQTEDPEGIATIYSIDGTTLKSDMTITVKDLVELPEAFALTGLKSVKDFANYGTSKLIRDFEAAGATCTQ